jgi:hypothetical protein
MKQTKKLPENLKHYKFHIFLVFISNNYVIIFEQLLSYKNMKLITPLWKENNTSKPHNVIIWHV